MAIWCDVQIGPRMKERRSRALMTWDNRGPRKVVAVLEVFTQWNIDVEELLHR